MMKKNLYKKIIIILLTILTTIILNNDIQTIAKVDFENIISTYSTNYNEDNYDRSNNIKIATARINNLIINPGETFSFNDILGERTPKQRI